MHSQLPDKRLYPSRGSCLQESFLGDLRATCNGCSQTGTREVRHVVEMWGNPAWSSEATRRTTRSECPSCKYLFLVDDSKWHALGMVVQFWDVLSTFSRLRVRFWYLHCRPFPILVRLWQTLTIKAHFVNLFYWSGKWAAYRCLDLGRFVCPMTIYDWIMIEWRMRNAEQANQWWMVDCEQWCRLDLSYASLMRTIMMTMMTMMTMTMTMTRRRRMRRMVMVMVTMVKKQTTMTIDRIVMCFIADADHDHQHQLPSWSSYLPGRLKLIDTFVMSSR